MLTDMCRSHRLTIEHLDALAQPGDESLGCAAFRERTYREASFLIHGGPTFVL
jgi:hypothetical protein